ncbi:hypothetical protein [Alteromonas sp. ASW11-130]|uniref:hypothetical protein n=1 Tax=Alteromonas sp. ASW11-130 TaxID=3015775 RepID=UPI002241BBE2|nr:hypothetical protein [Alteromonas sp. ASW11-130]MCW8091718.1 hypothetical protein [Alteromonas sp. ASW11-130]
MDVQNEQLKCLLERTDSAFKALMQEPGSIERNTDYEKAKQELDSYVASLRSTLAKR